MSQQFVCIDRACKHVTDQPSWIDRSYWRPIDFGDSRRVASAEACCPKCLAKMVPMPYLPHCEHPSIYDRADGHGPHCETCHRFVVIEDWLASQGA